MVVLSSLRNVVNTGVEAVVNGNNESFEDIATRNGVTVAAVVFLVLLLTLVLVLGKWLWNDYAVKYVTVFKPVTSVWQLLGLMVALDLVLPSSCMC